MEQTQTKTEGSTSSAPADGMVRPLEGRMVAGVALAVARRLELPEWAVRVAFIVTAFMGGLGIVLYAAGWALIRSENETESLAERFFSQAGTAQSWIGIGLIAIAGLIMFDRFNLFNDGFTWAAALLVIGILLYSGAIPTPKLARSERNGGAEPDPDPDGGPGPGDGTTAAFSTPAAPAPPRLAPPPTAPPSPPPAPKPPVERSYLGRLTMGTAMLALGVLAILDLSPLDIDPAPRHYLALLTVVLGLGLLVGAFVGRARHLILVGLILVPTLFVSPFWETGRSGWWSREFYPTSFSELESTYEVEFGSIDLDLTGLPWDGQDASIRVAGDAAAIRIWVPHRVTLRGNLSTDLGRVRAPSGGIGGIAPGTLDLDYPGEAPLWGTLRIDGGVDVGVIEVHTVYMEQLENQP